jgi:hypothetical protein
MEHDPELNLGTMAAYIEDLLWDCPYDMYIEIDATSGQLEYKICPADRWVELSVYFWPNVAWSKDESLQHGFIRLAPRWYYHEFSGV